jgi:3-dehydroquinate dehydratase/shikimate dehydrogenase
MDLGFTQRVGNCICAVIRESTGADIEQSISLARQGAAAVELRLDYLRISELTPANVNCWVRQAGCPVVLTLRRKPNGGEFTGSETEQMEILTSLLGVGAPFIDLEIETIENSLRGRQTPLGNAGPRWIASYHNFDETPQDLGAIYHRLLATKADILKVATFSRSLADNFRLLQLTDKATQDRQPVITTAMGELGALTRILAPCHGSLWTYGSVREGQESAPGQFTVDELKNVYAVDQTDPSTRIYGVIGYPITHSLSPHIHNSAFRQIGLNARYLPFPIQDLTDFGPHLKKFAGFSVTIPHKVGILDFVNVLDETVKVTGAANTLVKKADQIIAYNTDVDGVRHALQEPFKQRARHVTLLGTGGAARAAAWVLKQENCSVTVLARDRQKAKSFAESLGFAYDTLDRAEGYAGDLLINATSVGMFPSVEETPVPPQALRYRYVFDMVYNPLETRLMREAGSRAAVISGVEMFVAQGARQFELWTGRPAPRELMREIVLEKLRR